MSTPSAGLDFQHPECRQLAVTLLRRLVAESSLNEYLERVLPEISDLFGSPRMSLVDYREKTDHFELLHFEGYPDDSLHLLRRRLGEMQVSRALQTREPFWSDENPNLLCLPLYFSEVLEAVLVLEGRSRIELTPLRREAAALSARFLGLLMSSTRLKVNRDHMLDLNDLQRARQIQLSFLPRSSPLSPVWQIHGQNESSSLVGGDYYDFFRTQKGTVQGILADACGHGMAAALIMSNFRGLFQTEILRRKDFSGMFDSLNRHLHFEEDVIQYLTGVFLHFEEENKRLSYLNAGHFDPLLVTLGGEVRTLPGGGPPLGMFKDSVYPLGEAHLSSGDLVALFTDGIVDIENGDGKYFGMDGIVRVLQACRGLPLEETIQTVLREAREFAGGRRVEDDVTLFLFRVN